MARRRRHVWAGTVIAGLLLVAGGCGDGSDTPAAATDPPAQTATMTTPPATTAPATPPTPTPRLPGLPAGEAALIAGYPGWTELATPPTGAAAQRGVGAHGADKRVWAGPGAIGAPPYARGTVVVKEGRTEGDITLIAIMEKVRAADAATGGWRYAEYTRGAPGEAFRKVGFPESGCAACHAGAAETDFVFFTR